MKIWTMQLCRWRLARTAGIEIVNITVKSGLQWFAPTFNDVMSYKDGRISDLTYTERYRERMRKSFRLHPSEWQALKEKQNVAYACYCGDNQFCHRHIFVDFLTQYLTKEGVEFESMGELTKESRHLT